MASLEPLMSLGDYWEIVKRRKLAFILPFAVVLGIAATLAFTLPPTYRSEVTFLVQRQSVPQDMVATTINSYVEEQIEQIRQRLVTRKNLLEIADSFNLYQQELATDRDETIQKMRKDVEVEMLDVRASDPDRRTSEQVTTIAFTVAFSAPEAIIARDATNELAHRFLDEHEARRDTQAEEVEMFLAEQASELEEEIAELEAELASFKQDELRQLPELMGTNLRLFEKTEQDIEGAELRIRELQEQINVTRAELSLTPPYESRLNADGERVMSPGERLSVLTAEYFTASARYSSQHPDIRRLQRDIRLLTDQLGGNQINADAMLAELVNLEDQLRTARLNYGESHPEVQRLEREVSVMQRQFQQKVSEVVTRSGVQAAAPDNPRYVALATQLESNQSALAAENSKLSDRRERLAEYEGRLFQTPAVERDFRSITRNYETALAQYAELREKQRGAELARKLESGESGEKFILSGSAYLPVFPDSPNRIGIILLGFFLAGITGIGFVVMTEYLDKTVRSARMVAATLGVPPLVVIPRVRATRR